MELFSPLERDVLAALEEAGEENVAALLNTVGAKAHSVIDVEKVKTALMCLLDQGLLEIALRRDESSRRWLPLRRIESAVLIGQLGVLLFWSASEGIWKWESSSPRMNIILTEAGLAASRQILAEYGYPQAERN